jgi:hypothetical protein
MKKCHGPHSVHRPQVDTPGLQSYRSYKNVKFISLSYLLTHCDWFAVCQIQMSSQIILLGFKSTYKGHSRSNAPQFFYSSVIIPLHLLVQSIHTSSRNVILFFYESPSC